MKKVVLFIFAIMFVGFVSAQTTTPMKTSDLKKEITEHVAKNYPGYTIQNAFKVETNKVITYEVVAQKETNKVSLVYNDKGVFLKTENNKPADKNKAKKPTPKK